jgi:hypothetical protein
LELEGAAIFGGMSVLLLGLISYFVIVRVPPGPLRKARGRVWAFPVRWNSGGG